MKKFFLSFLIIMFMVFMFPEFVAGLLDKLNSAFVFFTSIAFVTFINAVESSLQFRDRIKKNLNESNEEVSCSVDTKLDNIEDMIDEMNENVNSIFENMDEMRKEMISLSTENTTDEPSIRTPQGTLPHIQEIINNLPSEYSVKSINKFRAVLFSSTSNQPIMLNGDEMSEFFIVTNFRALKSKHYSVQYLLIEDLMTIGDSYTKKIEVYSTLGLSIMKDTNKDGE